MKIIANFLVMGVLLGLVSLGVCQAKEEKVSEINPQVAASRDDALALARSYVQAQRQAVVTMNLQMTPEEAAAFWPVYGEYQAKLELLRDRMVKLIRQFADKFDTLTDDDAESMLEELLAIQEDEQKVKREFMPKFQKVLPIKKVARFYQIDNKINAEIRYGLSLEIPLLVAE